MGCVISVIPDLLAVVGVPGGPRRVSSWQRDVGRDVRTVHAGLDVLVGVEQHGGLPAGGRLLAGPVRGACADAGEGARLRLAQPVHGGSVHARGRDAPGPEHSHAGLGLRLPSGRHMREWRVDRAGTAHAGEPLRLVQHGLQAGGHVVRGGAVRQRRHRRRQVVVRLPSRVCGRRCLGVGECFVPGVLGGAVRQWRHIQRRFGRRVL